MNPAWFSDAARVLSTGTHALCERGCGSHSVGVEPVELNMDHPVRDWPDLKHKFDLVFYGLERSFLEVPGYCPACDTLFLSLGISGAWEAFDTALFSDILDRGDEGVVLDFGANIGWYSVLAAKMGYPVLAVEADLEISKALEANIEANSVSDFVQVVNGFVDDKTPMLPVDGAPRVRILKSDVEGLEGEVLRVCMNLFDAGMVDYAIIELTPVFSNWDSTKARVDEVMELGYELRIVPDKGFPTKKFSEDPLGSTMGYMNEDIGDQSMGLLIRGDLV